MKFMKQKKGFTQESLFYGWMKKSLAVRLPCNGQVKVL
jgi:hypothetical protein